MIDVNEKKKAPRRYMGLDFGDKTIGVSISSPSGKVAIGMTTLTRQDEISLRPNLKALKVIIRESGITDIVLGYPKHLDGRDSPRCNKTIAFKDKLTRYFKYIPVELWDERLSTRAVSRTFEGKRGSFKKHVDEMAAVYILQGFLDNLNLRKRSESDMEQPMFDSTGEDAIITLYDEDGNEVEMQVLASRQEGDSTYLLVVEEDEDEDSSEVILFKLIEDGDNDTIFEMVDEEHEDFDRVFELFKEDYAALGIEVEDFGI